MEDGLKTLELKGRVVFQKLRIRSFTRLPKEYHENEAYFVFVNEGEFQVRSQTDVMQVNRDKA